MDTRFEVLRIDGRWSLSHDDGPRPLAFLSQPEAIAAGVARARDHHRRTGGQATVHLWSGGQETMVFDTRADNRPESPGSQEGGAPG